MEKDERANKMENFTPPKTREIFQIRQTMSMNNFSLPFGIIQMPSQLSNTSIRSSGFQQCTFYN